MTLSTHQKKKKKKKEKEEEMMLSKLETPKAYYDYYQIKLNR